jgi:hypothetical protein
MTMQKLTLALFTLGLLASTAHAQFTNQQHENPTSPVYLECAVMKEEPKDKNDHDPVYKINIGLAFDETGKPTAIAVVHTTINNNQYSRSEQYKDNVALWQVEGKLEWYWGGRRISDKKQVTMLGKILQTNGGAWFYQERLFNQQEKVVYVMTAQCHEVSSK